MSGAHAKPSRLGHAASAWARRTSRMIVEWDGCPWAPVTMMESYAAACWILNPVPEPPQSEELPPTAWFGAPPGFCLALLCIRPTRTQSAEPRPAPVTSAGVVYQRPLGDLFFEAMR
ncbi:DUF6087 family protein [Streptomyces sp. CG1]|uniref:DUF6087 family protein n=1 Tax=Streptomyces sp. CG1 TaxID=1287523 RepID=UPI0034E2FA7B